MRWRDRIALLLGSASPIVMGVGAHAATVGPSSLGAGNVEGKEQELLIFSDPQGRAVGQQLAEHASHASHASHSSHYSGSGGGGDYGDGGDYVASPPPSPPVRPAPPQPPTQGLAGEAAPNASSAPLTEIQISEFVQRVQIALIMRGYDPGSVDGKLGAQTKSALASFQTKNGLAATGYMDVATLKLLGITP